MSDIAGVSVRIWYRRKLTATWTLLCPKLSTADRRYVMSSSDILSSHWLKVGHVTSHINTYCIMMAPMYMLASLICRWMYSVSQKEIPLHQLRFSDISNPNGWEFLISFLLTYYTFLSTLHYKLLFNYLQLWRSCAMLSATTQRFFLHCTITLTSKFAYWANNVTVDVMSYPTCLLTL